MTLTLLKPGELRPVSETLADGAYIVGRGKAAKIQLPYADVSERHALIVVRSGMASIEDLKSANGTYVNGQQIDRMVQLSDDTIVQIGSTVLRVTTGAAKQATAAQVAPEQTPSPVPAPSAAIQPPTPPPQKTGRAHV